MQGESKIKREEAGKRAFRVAAERTAGGEARPIVQPIGGREFGAAPGLQQEATKAAAAGFGGDRGKQDAADPPAERFRRGPHRLDLPLATAESLERADSEEPALLPRGKEGDGRISQRRAWKDMAGLGRRMGVHGGDVEGQELLDVGACKFAGVDGEGHRALPTLRVKKRRGEGLTARSGTRRTPRSSMTTRMTYRISGLDPARFASLVGRSDAELAALGAARRTVSAHPGFPCRICLDDAEPGTTVLLVNHVSVKEGPYAASHAIFVGESQEAAALHQDLIPPALERRILSVRAFSSDHLLIDAALARPGEGDTAIRLLFANPEVDYIHVHYAIRGCFAAAVERA